MNVQELQREMDYLRQRLDETRKMFDFSEPSTEIKALAAKVEKRLGYTVLSTDGLLKRALAKLEIEVLDRDIVDRYKAAVLESRNHWWTWQQNTWRWRDGDIKDFKKPIPEFVLVKAMQIAEALPHVRIEVVVCQKGSSREYFPDPFLVAEFGDERYYVEVWDEHVFEGRLRPKEKDGKQV